MMLILPKNVYPSTIFRVNESNFVVVNGAVKEVANEALLLWQIIVKAGIRLLGRETMFEVKGSSIRRWVRLALGNACERATVIGYWCDFVLVKTNEEKEGKDRVRAAFTTDVFGRSLPFLYSCISKRVVESGSPFFVEDYIWLAEKGKPADFSFEAFDEFIRSMEKDMEDPFHPLYTSSEVRRILSDYTIAVSARLYKLYGRKWADFLSCIVFDRLMDGDVTPFTRKICGLLRFPVNLLEGRSTGNPYRDVELASRAVEVSPTCCSLNRRWRL